MTLKPTLAESFRVCIDAQAKACGYILRLLTYDLQLEACDLQLEASIN